MAGPLWVARSMICLGKISIFPLCKILRIDENKNLKRDDRNWTVIQKFFQNNIELLKNLAEEKKKESTTDRIISRCADNVVEAVERQLGKMCFFMSASTEHILVLIEYAPLTNSGFESRQAQLDVWVKFRGGSAPVETISNKPIFFSE